MSLSVAEWASQNPASAVESAVLSGNRHGALGDDALKAANTTARDLSEELLITEESDNFDRETPATHAVTCRNAKLRSFPLAQSIEMLLGYCEAHVPFLRL